jgi:chemotaxis signal transduction protein
VREIEAVDRAQDFVLFVVGGEVFGTELTAIAEVVRPGPLTYVPGARSDIRGITSVRGRIIAVVDMCRALGLRAREPASDPRNTRLLIAEYNDEAVGFLVERVHEVVSIADTAIDDASSLGTPEKPYLRGVARVGTDTVVLVSVDALSPVARTTRAEPT